MSNPSHRVWAAFSVAMAYELCDDYSLLKLGDIFRVFHLLCDLLGFTRIYMCIYNWQLKKSYLLY